MSKKTNIFGAQSTAEEVTEGLDLQGTNWLITGFNSGLGYETARVFASKGAHIIGSARTREKATNSFASLQHEGTPVVCELSDLDSVRSCIQEVKKSGLKLDGIIANAGVMALPELQQKHDIELQFFTNHIGHFLLVTELLEQLKEQGRVVILSSGAHRMASRGIELDNISGEKDYEPWRMYGRSKLANILFANSLSKRFRESGSQQTANSLHPGVIETNLTRHLPGRTFPEGWTNKTVEQGAATQCYVAAHPDLAGVSGKYFSDCQESKTRSFAQDDNAAEQLWRLSEEIVAKW